MEFIKDLSGKTVRVEKPNGLRKKTIGDTNPNPDLQLRLVCYYNEPAAENREPLVLIPEDPEKDGVLVKGEDGRFVSRPAPPEIFNDQKPFQIAGQERRSSEFSRNSEEDSTSSSASFEVNDERVEILRRMSSASGNGGDPIAMLLAAASLDEKAKAEQGLRIFQKELHSSKFQPSSPSLIMTPPATPTTASPSRTQRNSAPSFYSYTMYPNPAGSNTQPYCQSSVGVNNATHFPNHISNRQQTWKGEENSDNLNCRRTVSESQKELNRMTGASSEHHFYTNSSAPNRRRVSSSDLIRNRRVSIDEGDYNRRRSSTSLGRTLSGFAGYEISAPSSIRPKAMKGADKSAEPFSRAKSYTTMPINS